MCGFSIQVALTVCAVMCAKTLCAYSVLTNCIEVLCGVFYTGYVLTDENMTICGDSETVCYTSAARVVSSEVRAMVCQFVQQLRECLDDVRIAKERKHDVIEDAMASFRERSAKSDATLDWPIGAWFY